MSEETNTTWMSCPACQTAPARCLGRIRAAGGNILLSEPGSIYECRSCGFLFRRPYVSAETLAQAYRALPAELWDNSAGRYDFLMAAGIIQRSVKSGRVLDVGCYRGDFLSMLPERYTKYGVEPVLAARRIAEQRGIRLIADSLQDIRIGEQTFDAVTAIDVVEHLADPILAMEKLARVVKPGGLLVVSTGNSDAIPWRLMRSDYWYYFADHVSFFNPRWFRWMVGRFGLEVVRVRKFSHSRRAYAPGATRERYRELARCLAFWVSSHVRRYWALERSVCRLYPLSRVLRWEHAPGTSCWPDHILVVMRRKC